MNNSVILYAMLAVLAIAVLSCSGEPEAGEATGKKADELSERPKTPFPVPLHGEWVDADYIADVKRTKSPVRSSVHLGGITTMIIDSTAMAEDTLEVGAVYANHEGGSFGLYFRPGQKANSFPISESDYDHPTNFYELGYEIRNNDTSLFLYNYNSKGQLFYKRRYIRVQYDEHKGLSGEGGIQHIVNKHLVAGTYATADTTGNTFEMSFGENGELSGFPGAATYYVITDFVVEGENSADQICFDIQTPKQQCYAFRIAGDTLRLYKAVEDEDASLTRYGALLYTLVKRK